MRTLLIWLFVVFILSVYPFEGGARYPFADKAFHFVLYGITCALVVTVLKRPLRAKGMVFSGVILASVVASSSYGLLMEAVQGFVPGRDFSLWDAIANLLGSVSGAGYMFVKGRGSGRGP